jgi:hypothetical protein
MARRTTKNCWACSTELDSSAKYCSSCGTIVDKSACYPEPDRPKKAAKPEPAETTQYDSYRDGWHPNGRWGNTSDEDAWVRSAK